ncbi:MAG: TIGR00159 family protein [Acidobacteria bacterium]|nr:TIGR00159 family protein [Acidobacteriota bacterium]
MDFSSLLQLVTARDLIDIALVAVVFYNLLLLIRGTRAVQVLLGLVFFAGLYWASGLARLATLEKILSGLLIVLPFAIIVLFQHEIRRGLATFGRNPLLTNFGAHQLTETTIHEVVLAASALATRKTGALIVLQRLEGLRNYVENGIRIDSRVSYDLLINIFTPGAPLHDGAVIIYDNRIAAASCFLPVKLDAEISTEFGTRHRAALGISSESDALAMVVSEETGSISLAVAGVLIRDLDSKTLRNHLYRYLITELGTTEGTG